MKTRISLTLGFLILLLCFAFPAQAGGWAVISLTKLPGQVVAGQPLTIEFAVRQHGVHLTSDFGSPTVYATQPETGEKFMVTGQKTARTGYFTAELTFPSGGLWDWKIAPYNEPTGAQNMPFLNVLEGSGLSTVPESPGSMSMVLGMVGVLVVVMSGAAFWVTRIRWVLGIGLTGFVLAFVGLAGARQPLPQTVQPESALAAAPLSAVEQGQVLFLSKGCVVCHTHADAQATYTGFQTNLGPNLTGTKLSVDYLRVWLKDPSALKPETEMPNLELKETEIEALAAFLTAGQ